MSSTSRIVVLVALVAVLGGWAFGQQQRVVESPGQPFAQPVLLAPGRFVVTAVGNSAVLVDSTTGQSWTFNNERGARWVPFAGGIEHASGPDFLPGPVLRPVE